MSYLESAIPQDGKHTYSLKTSWRGLNLKNTIDSGELSFAKNISMTELPYLRTAPLPDGESSPNALAKTFAYIGQNPGGADQYCCAYISSGVFYAAVYTVGSTVPSVYSINTTSFWPPASPANEDIRIVPFNRYSDFGDSNTQNIVSSTYTRYVLFYPMNVSLNIDAVSPSLTVFSFKNSTGSQTWASNLCPVLDNIAVHQGRVWGTHEGKLYASKWNQYESWTLPTASDIEEGKDVSSWAWVSETQSDIMAAEDFTAIVSYDSHIVAFKKHFMHQVYNTKNPFRIVDIAKVGCVSQNALCVCNRILFFVAEDGVYSYTGSYPEKISEKLNITSCSDDCVLGCDDRTVYFWDGTKVYTYDTENGCWSSVDVTGTPLRMEHIGHHCFVLTETVSGGTTTHNVAVFGRGDTYGTFEIQTDMIWRGTINENRILKLRLYVSKLEDGVQDWIKLYVSTSVKNEGWQLKKVLYTSAAGDTVISVTPRLLADFGHSFRIEGTGSWIIRYFYEEFLDADRQNRTTGITTI